MKRRDILIGTWRWMLVGAASWLGACRSTAYRPDDGTDALQDDVQVLRGRDYSEVGVCMLLTGENLQTAVASKQDLGGRRLAQVLGRYARTFIAAKPDAEEDDVAALVELVADRDFQAGGREFPS